MADDVIASTPKQEETLKSEGAERVTGGGGDAILARKPDDTYIEVAPDGTVTEDAKAPKERTALEAVAGSAITMPARLGFDQQQVVAIRNTVAADCNPGELVMFLEVAARYELDPFARQIYAAKIKGKVQIIVSRDGLLAHAHKQDSFVKMDGDYICANDDFKSTYKDGERSIEHSFKTGLGDPAKDVEPGDARGKIIGAWAIVERKGHGKTFFLANFSEYFQDRDGPWKKTPAAMILKCAETYALRKAFSISGVVGEDEVEKDQKKMLTDVETGKTRVIEFSNIDFGEEPRSTFIAELAGIANEIEANSYRPAKLQALAGDPEALKVELEGFIRAHDREVPEETIDGTAEEDSPVATAA